MKETGIRRTEDGGIFCEKCGNDLSKEGSARILAQTYRYPCEETCEDCKPKDAWCLAQEAVKNMQKAGFGASEVKAHWIERKVRMWAKGGKPYFGYEQECSHCGCINKSKKRWSSKFCFECGAKMQKED